MKIRVILVSNEPSICLVESMYLYDLMRLEIDLLFVIFFSLYQSFDAEKRQEVVEI